MARIALLQSTTGIDPEANGAALSNAIAAAADGGAEMLFTPVLWPDFDEPAFKAALAEFAARQRRFGGR